MGRKSKSTERWPLTKRLLSYLVFFVVLGLAARPLSKGALFYQSYWGGAVFVPFILLVAVLVVVAFVLDWKRK